MSSVTKKTPRPGSDNRQVACWHFIIWRQETKTTKTYRNGLLKTNNQPACDDDGQQDMKRDMTKKKWNRHWDGQLFSAKTSLRRWLKFSFSIWQKQQGAGPGEGRESVRPAPVCSVCSWPAWCRWQRPSWPSALAPSAAERWGSDWVGGSWRSAPAGTRWQMATETKESQSQISQYDAWRATATHLNRCSSGQTAFFSVSLNTEDFMYRPYESCTQQWWEVRGHGGGVSQVGLEESVFYLTLQAWPLAFFISMYMCVCAASRTYLCGCFRPFIVCSIVVPSMLIQRGAPRARNVLGWRQKMKIVTLIAIFFYNNCLFKNLWCMLAVIG